MLTIRKLVSEDFEKALPLLEMFENDDISTEEWKKLFYPVCKKLNNDYFGFVLIDNKKIVGIIAAIQSLKRIKNTWHKICNISSWIVHPEYRNKKMGFLLFEELMKMSDFSFYALSPVKHTIDYYKKNYGFKEHKLKFLIIPRLPQFLVLKKTPVIYINQPLIREYLSEYEKDIYNDHQLPNIFHVMYFFKKQPVYCIIKPSKFSSYALNSSIIIKAFTKVWFKVFNKDFFKPQISLGLIHYTNNTELFCSSLSSIVNYVSKKINVKGLCVNEKMLSKPYPYFSIRNNLNYMLLHKSELLDADDFDTLYSELTIMNLTHFES